MSSGASGCTSVVDNGSLDSGLSSKGSCTFSTAEMDSEGSTVVKDAAELLSITVVVAEDGPGSGTLTAALEASVPVLIVRSVSGRRGSLGGTLT